MIVSPKQIVSLMLSEDAMGFITDVNTKLTGLVQDHTDIDIDPDVYDVSLKSRYHLSAFEAWAVTKVLTEAGWKNVTITGNEVRMDF